MSAESPHISLPRSLYYKVYAILMALLVLTVAVSYINLGEFNIILALIIAFVKAGMVILIFMHIRYSSRLLWLFAAIGFVWLGTLLAGVFMDYYTR